MCLNPQPLNGAFVLCFFEKSKIERQNEGLSSVDY